MDVSYLKSEELIKIIQDYIKERYYFDYMEDDTDCLSIFTSDNRVNVYVSIEDCSED